MELPSLSTSPTSLADMWQHFAAVLQRILRILRCPSAKRHPTAAADAVVKPSRQMVVSTGVGPLSMGLDAALHLRIPVSTHTDRFLPTGQADSMSTCNRVTLVISDYQIHQPAEPPRRHQRDLPASQPPTTSTMMNMADLTKQETKSCYPHPAAMVVG